MATFIEALQALGVEVRVSRYLSDDAAYIVDKRLLDAPGSVEGWDHSLSFEQNILRQAEKGKIVLISPKVAGTEVPDV